MTYHFLLLLLLLFSACKTERKIDTAFYFWKTRYKWEPTELQYLDSLHVKKLYVRIMDVSFDETSGSPIPVMPIVFKNPLPGNLEIVPVVFISNNILSDISKPQLHELASRVLRFVEAKVHQSGKSKFTELQIDCDWTASTRDNYFYLLQQIQDVLKGEVLSATLRLHQLKNLERNGIPPVDRVMLMCYNMGNLRKYGDQNSILDLAELKKYAGDNLTHYPVQMDLGLPLFSWAVVFRNKQYAGISKTIRLAELQKRNQFNFTGKNRYHALVNMPQYGIRANDELRWEDSSLEQLREVADYLSPLLSRDSLNLIYFHLDEATIKHYSPYELQKTADLLR